MKSSKYISILCVGSLLSLASCTDGFESDNKINGSFDDTVKEYDFQKYTTNFETIQKGIYFNYDWGEGTTWPWQTFQNLNHDMFSGYFHDFASKFSDKNTVYALEAGWTASAWNYTYNYIFPVAHKSTLITQDEAKYKHFYGATLILKVEAMHRITDTYGPIVYSKFRKNETNSVDTQEEAYKAFFDDLDKAVDALDTYLKEGGKEDGVKSINMCNCPTASRWIKFANSLRLRLAMRVSNVDKTLATSEAQKALENSYGVIESSDENIQISGKGYQNPLAGVAGWGETYMGATIASVLNGYEDPRISIYYNPATLAEHTEEYLGVPQGVYAKDGDPNYYQSYSFINTQTITASTPAVLLTAAETWFLRAEASLRGINPKNESAKQCYETGVQTSFSQWGAGDASLYLTSKGKPTDYINYAAGPGKDMKALITTTPNFDDAVNQEEQLEKIITQKWIACWPEGMEAWAEQRRTGYPKLFKVQTNNSNGTIDTDIMIRRLPFSQDDAKKDPEQYKNLCTALGGADNGGTRLWWDTGKNNF